MLREGAWVVEIKGRRPGDAGKPPAPAAAPRHRQAAARRYRIPLPSPSLGAAAFPGGGDEVSSPHREDNKPREPVRGGRHGASSQTSSPPHTYCQQAERRPPHGPEFGLGTHHLPVLGGESTHGRARRSPRALPGSDKATRVHGSCWLRLPARHKGESTRPGTGPAGMQGSRDAQIRSIPRGSRAQALWDALPGVTACRDRSEHPVPDR